MNGEGRSHGGPRQPETAPRNEAPATPYLANGIHPGKPLVVRALRLRVRACRHINGKINVYQSSSDDDVAHVQQDDAKTRARAVPCLDE